MLLLPYWVYYSIDEVFQFNIKTLAQLFLNGRVITYFSFKRGLMNCRNCMTMPHWNLLNSCLTSKYGSLEAVTFTFSVLAGSFNPLSPGGSKGDPAGKTGICKNTCNLIRLRPSLWNILKFNLPSLFHYCSKWNFKSEHNISKSSTKSFPPR